jgi:hypothetical protein
LPPYVSYRQELERGLDLFLSAKVREIPVLSRLLKVKLAEGVGFEPTVRLPVRLISSQVPSTTQPPFHSEPELLPHFGCARKLLLDAAVSATAHAQKNFAQLKLNCVVQLKTTMFCAGANRFLIDHCLDLRASSAP